MIRSAAAATGYVATSAALVIRPPYASSVHSVSTVGAVILMTGAAPPNV